MTQIYMNQFFRRNILIIASLALLSNLVAQDLQKDVTVVKSYQPTMQDATKISQMPAFKDTTYVSPTFDYRITPVRLNIPFQPRPVNAAKMVADPLKILYGSYLKLGFGYPLTPLAELNVANMRSKENAYGVFLKHYSANGSVTLADKREVKAPFSENIINAYGKHLFKESELSGNIGYSTNKVNYYGYDTALKTINKDTIKDQLFQRFAIHSRLESLNTDSAELYYTLDGGYNYLKDSYGKYENNLYAQASIGKRIGEFYMGGSMLINNYAAYGFKDTVNNALFCFRPRIGKAKGDWRVDVGIDGQATKSGFY